MTDEMLRKKVADAIRDSGITDVCREAIDAANAATQAYHQEIATRLRSRRLDAALAMYEELDGSGIVH
jgi:hypothetical protein